MAITNLKREGGLIVAFLNDEIKWMSFFYNIEGKISVVRIFQRL